MDFCWVLMLFPSFGGLQYYVIPMTDPCMVYIYMLTKLGYIDGGHVATKMAYIRILWDIHMNIHLNKKLWTKTSYNLGIQGLSPRSGPICLRRMETERKRMQERSITRCLGKIPRGAKHISHRVTKNGSFSSMSFPLTCFVNSFLFNLQLSHSHIIGSCLYGGFLK